MHRLYLAVLNRAEVKLECLPAEFFRESGATVPRRRCLNAESLETSKIRRGTSQVMGEGWSSSSGLDGRKPQVPELQAQGLPGDPQQESGLLEIAARVLQDARQQQPVQLAVRLRVQVTNVGPDPLPDDERLHAGLCRRRRRRGCFARPLPEVQARRPGAGRGRWP